MPIAFKTGKSGTRTMSQYRVIFADDELMKGEDWIVCNMHADGVILFVRRGTRHYTDDQVAAMLEEALTGYHNIMERVTGRLSA